MSYLTLYYFARRASSPCLSKQPNVTLCQFIHKDKITCNINVSASSEGFVDGLGLGIRNIILRSTFAIMQQGACYITVAKLR
jgi:hypothetical protein